MYNLYKLKFKINLLNLFSVKLAKLFKHQAIYLLYDLDLFQTSVLRAVLFYNSRNVFYNIAMVMIK